jgi:hypothetical protein
MGIDGNEIADQLPREGSSHPTIGPQPLLGIPAKVAMEVSRDWTSTKHEQHWQSICGQRQAKGFLGGRKLNKKAGELLSLSRNQVRRMTGLLTEYCHLKGHQIKLVLVHSPKCDGCKQASEMTSHILCHCKALATLRYRHLGHHIMKPGDFEDISVSKTLHFALGTGLENE